MFEMFESLSLYHNSGQFGDIGNNITDKNICHCGECIPFHPIFVKGTHTIYLSSSLYIINQKPMIPRIYFHCIRTWVAHVLGKIWPCICLYCGFGLLTRWRYYPI